MSLAIKDKAGLYAAYMPFIQGGGLFIPTSKPYKLGEEVFLLLTLLDDPEKIRVVGRVVWVTPLAQNNRPQGMGVRFSEKDGGVAAKSKIEALLGSALNSGRPTHTF